MGLDNTMKQIAITMFGVHDWYDIPEHYRVALTEAKDLVRRCGGELVSRQAIAAVIASVTATESLRSTVVTLMDEQESLHAAILELRIQNQRRRLKQPII